MQKRRILLVSKALFSVGLLWVLYRRMDIGRLAEHLANTRISLLLLAVAIMYLNTLLSAAKWRLLLAADGVRIPLRRLFSSYLIGTFFNVFLPSTIGGDVYRIADISRHSKKGVHTAASVFADRISGFLALASYGLIFPLSALKLLPNRMLLLLPAGLFGALLFMVFLLWQQGILRWIAGRFGGRWTRKLTGLLDTFLASFRAYARDRGMLAGIFAISFLFQFNVIVAVFLIGHSLSLPVPFAAFCVFVPLVLLMEALPISIYGLGLRDAGYVLFLVSAMGRPPGDAAALSLLFVTLSLLYAAQGAVLWLFKRSRKKVYQQSVEPIAQEDLVQ